MTDTRKQYANYCVKLITRDISWEDPGKKKGTGKTVRVG